MTPSESSGSVRLERLAFGSALFFAALAALPLFASAGFLSTRGIGDSPYLLLRTQQGLAALLNGEFPIRWMPEADYGYGFPFFNYYAPLSTYIAALLKLYGFSFVTAIKLTQLLALLGAAGGLYGWARRVTLTRAQSVLAAAAYTFAPFHLVNVYVRGDSLAELWAMALFPLALWAAQRNMEQPSLGRAFTFAVVTGALVCAHNISALNFMPFLGLYVVLSSWANVRRLLPSAVCLLSLIWSLALSAFFWAPALGERPFVQLGGLTQGFFFYGDHFRSGDLLQLAWLFDYQDRPFSMGLAQTVLAGCGLVMLAWRALHRRQWTWLNTFVLVGLSVSTVMITPLSKPVWERLPLLPYTQFPWRFLSIQSLFTAMLTAHLLPASLPLRSVADRRMPQTASLVTLLLSGWLAVSALAPLRPEFIPLTDADVTAERLNLYEYFTASLGSTVGADYLPQWVTPRPFTSEVMLGRAPRLKVLNGDALGERLWKHGSTEQWRVEVSGSNSATVAVPTHYWPGWAAEMDGRALDVRPAEGIGWIELDVPPGIHTVTLRLGRTPLRLGAELFSLLALLAPLALLLYRARPLSLSPRHLVILSACLGIWSLGFGILRVWPAPPARPLPLSMDYETSPYAHHDVVRFEDGTELRSVEYSADHLQRGEALTVTTRWNLARSGQAHFRLAPPPAYPAPPLPSTSATLERVSGTDTSLSVSLPIPTDIPPGVYFVAVQFSDKQTVYPAVTASGRYRGPVYLAPVWVDDEGTLAAESMTPLADFGAIRVVTATAALEAGDSVAARLLWQALADVPRNYQLALRLRDAAGNEWGSGGDRQTAFGFYPTSLWRPGELVPDFYRVPLAGPGEPPGDYQLWIALYDVGSLRTIGEARIPVTLNRRHPRGDRVTQFPLTPNLGLERVEFPSQAAQGDALPITAIWLTGPQPNPPYRARWSLYRSDNPASPVHTHVLDLAPASPTQRWPLEAYLIGRVRFPLPADLAPGAYTLGVQLVDEADRPIGFATGVGMLEVTGRARDFSVPPYQTEVGATFDGQLKLWGYDSARTESELRLTLVWSALEKPRGDYKFFVHLFNTADGFIPVQADAAPRSFTYPTTHWAKDEVVTDTVTLNIVEDLAPGQYRLAIGWYDPNTPDLARLPAFDAQGQRLELDRAVLPFELRAP